MNKSKLCSPPAVQRLTVMPWVNDQCPSGDSADIDKLQLKPLTQKDLDIAYDIQGTRGRDFYMEEIMEVDVSDCPSPTRDETVFMGDSDKKFKRLRVPAWFLQIDQVCIKCKKFVKPSVINFHLKHISSKAEFPDAPLLRSPHFEIWGAWFGRVCRHVLKVLDLTHPSQLVDLVNRRMINRDLPLKPTWSSYVFKAVRLYFQKGGMGLVHPDSITVNPANCINILADPVIFMRLATVYKPLRKTAAYKF